LTKTNYNEWSLLMKVKLQARHLWDVVEHGDGDFHDDRTALEAICSAVPPELVSSLATKETAHDAWKAIKTLRIGDDRVRKATAHNLRTEYEAISLRDDETIEDFALRLTGIVQRLATLGDPEPDAKVVAKYLRVVRPRYKQLGISIETLLDISALSIEEITGRLKAADDVDPTPPQAASGKLLLTEEQCWRGTRSRTPGTEGRAPALGASGAASCAAAMAAATPTVPARAQVRPGQVTPASVAARKATGPKIAVANSRWRSRPMWPKTTSPP